MFYNPTIDRPRAFHLTLMFLIVIVTILFLCEPRSVHAQLSLSDPQINPHLCMDRDHVYGLPMADDLRCNAAYTFLYDPERRLSTFVAWRVDGAQLYQMDRISPVRSFLVDPSVLPRLSPRAFLGLAADPRQGYVRGHLMPFWAAAQDRGIAGAFAFVDRNNDGKITAADRDATGSLLTYDPLDFEALRAVNQTTNLSPMHAAGINGSSAAWNAVETYEREILAKGGGLSFFVVAGPAWLAKPLHDTEHDDPIPVAPAFFRLLYLEPPFRGAEPPLLAFLFLHKRTPSADPLDHLVSLAHVEAATGLDFFSGFAPTDRETWRRRDTSENLPRFPPF
jgi:DNA/RNA endonuclease G (NUC1)